MDYREHDIRQWTQDYVAHWLREIGMPELVNDFSAQRINGHRLLQLTESDFKFKSLKSSRKKKLKEHLSSLPGSALRSNNVSNSVMPALRPPIQSNSSSSLGSNAPPLPPRPSNYDEPPEDIYEEFDDSRPIEEDEDSFDDDYEEEMLQKGQGGQDKRKFSALEAKLKAYGIGGGNQFIQPDPPTPPDDDYGDTGEDIYDLPPEGDEPPPPPPPPPPNQPVDDEFDDPNDIYDLPPEEALAPPIMRPPIGHHQSQGFPEPYIEAHGHEIEEDIYELEDPQDQPPPPPPPPEEDVEEDIYDIAEDDPFQRPTLPPKLPSKAPEPFDSKQVMPAHLRERYLQRQKVSGSSLPEQPEQPMGHHRPPPEVPPENHPPPASLPPKPPPKEEPMHPMLPPKPGSPPSMPKLPPKPSEAKGSDTPPPRLPPKELLQSKEPPLPPQPVLPPKPESPRSSRKYQPSPVMTHRPPKPPPTKEERREEPSRPVLPPLKPVPKVPVEDKSPSPPVAGSNTVGSPIGDGPSHVFSRKRSGSKKIGDLMSKFEQQGQPPKPAAKPKTAPRKWPPVGAAEENNKPNHQQKLPPKPNLPPKVTGDKPKLPAKEVSDKPKPPPKEPSERPPFKPTPPLKSKPSPPPSPGMKRPTKSPHPDSSGSLDSDSVSNMLHRLRPKLAGDSMNAADVPARSVSPANKPPPSLPSKPQLPPQPPPKQDKESRPLPRLNEPHPSSIESRPPPLLPSNSNNMPVLPPKPQADEPPPVPPSMASPSLPPKASPLESYPWYHGKLSRDDVLARLRRAPQDGCFLLRDAQKGEGYSLSLWYGGNVRHLRVRIREDRQYVVGEKKDHELAFPTLPELITFHKKEPLVLKSGGQTLLSIVCSK